MLKITFIYECISNNIDFMYLLNLVNTNLYHHYTQRPVQGEGTPQHNHRLEEVAVLFKCSHHTHNKL